MLAQARAKNELARRMGTDKRCVSDVINRRRAVMLDTAKRLAAVFGTSLKS